MSDLIASLAANIVERKRAGAEPYVLFLGAGASISSGCSSMVALVDDVLQQRDPAGFAGWQVEIDGIDGLPEQYRGAVWNEIARRKRQRFFELWGALDSETRFAILQHHLAALATPADGYRDLAQLIKAGYFRLALTTNLDNLLEHALEDAGWHLAQHFVVVANRRDKPEEVRYQIEHAHVPFTIVKLHGTLESPGSYAFTPPEIFDFEQSIKPTLARVIRQSLLVVGHSMQDRDIDVLFEEAGGEIHYVNPQPPEPRHAPVHHKLDRLRGQRFEEFCSNGQKPATTMSR